MREDQIVPTLVLSATCIVLIFELLLGVWYPRRWDWLRKLARMARKAVK